ncbi:hypothetical protein ACQKD9_11950 [Bacillus paramycoides]|uniref:hypothetical protein n=1 Tax=Bacillus paramycoides TaxID=2026194 RepID=UPI003CFDD8E5
MSKYLVIYKETDVVGYDSMDEVDGARVNVIDAEREEIAAEEGIKLGNVTFEEAMEITQSQGGGDPTPVYEVEAVIEALIASDLDQEDKDALMEELTQDDIDFKVEGIFQEIIGKVDPIRN